MTKYNKELLEECLKRDNATLIGYYEKLNREMYIKFKCSCGEEGEKRFKFIISIGATCSKCSKKKGVNKMNKISYDEALLNDCLIKDNAILIGEYNLLNTKTNIKFKCRCGNEENKIFCNIYKGGAICNVCTRIKSSKLAMKTMGKFNYTFEELKNIEIRDNASLLEEYKNLNSKTKIKFKCSCGNEEIKLYSTIYEHSGLYCKICSHKNKRTKGLNANKFMYDNSFLKKSLEESNACLIEEYVNPNSRTFINFICSCGKEHSKTLETIHETGAYCKECTRVNTSNKTNTICYTHQTLKDVLKRDNASIKEEHKEINVETNIKFICSCGEPGHKSFRTIYTIGAYCEECTNKTRIIKFENTIIEKYGVNSVFKLPEIQEKIKATNLQKRGVDHSSQCKEVKDKRKNTCLEKYGFHNAMQNPEIALKNLNSCLNPKEYTLPSGNKIQVQGYEPLALDILINEWKVEEENIITERTKVPEIWWKDKGDKSHRYYTDIFIPSKNLIIEVKSTWTYKIEKDITQRKLLSANDLGYNTLLLVFNDRKKLVEEYEDCNFKYNKITNIN